MKLTVYASGSKGNCYELFDGSSRILLECGLSPKRFGSLVGYPGAYAGVLISHEHMDHARAAAHCVTLGMPVYMTEGTFAALDDVPNMPNLHELCAGEPLPIGSYDVLPLRSFHDAADPVCFVIHSRADGETLFFATDTGYLHHPISGMTIVAIECNYAEAYLTESAKIPAKVIERIRRNHMSIERLERYLAACDLSKTREIYLLHLSDAHSHAVDFRRTIHHRYGLPVYIA